MNQLTTSEREMRECDRNYEIFFACLNEAALLDNKTRHQPGAGDVRHTYSQ
ncbi:hypothetical protein SAMN02745181_3259 [Rubritalea squalenifaciens DSM 18772]|uniref:Uncharacterized protein n=1 Tax=Rubritalea squalenifaciens DSM 18772 TaxID=1123071 RepID=A0A1M6PQC2_9BACT|nr:hypothetical protein SAMN02745181_3259 [Rubritalea squalenifaciens DSM 18772]